MSMSFQGNIGKYASLTKFLSLRTVGGNADVMFDGSTRDARFQASKKAGLGIYYCLR